MAPSLLHAVGTKKVDDVSKADQKADEKFLHQTYVDVWIKL